MPNVTMNGAPVVVNNDPFIPHRFTSADVAPHPTSILANPVNVTVGGKVIATELSNLICGDLVLCISPSKTNIGEPVGTSLRGPQAGPRSNYNVYISNWPVITYRDSGLSVRYQAGDAQRGASDIIRWVCQRGPITPVDGYTEISVSGPPGIQTIKNYPGPPFSPNSGCIGLPNWAKYLESPLRVAIKIREVITANGQNNSSEYTEVAKLDENRLSYDPEEGIIRGIDQYPATNFFRIVAGNIRRVCDMIVIKFQPGFYYEGSYRFPIEEKINGVYVEQQEIKIPVRSTTVNCPQA